MAKALTVKEMCEEYSDYNPMKAEPYGILGYDYNTENSIWGSMGGTVEEDFDFLKDCSVEYFNYDDDGNISKVYIPDIEVVAEEGEKGVLL